MEHTKTMQAVVYKEQGVFALEERPVPKLLEPTDAIVRVTLASICSSDLHIKHGSVPRAVKDTIVGHEMVGVIAELGEAVSGFSVGDRVAVNVETFCGSCFYCQRGWVNNCVEEQGGWALGCRIDGGQATYVRVPFAGNGLTKIPDSITDAQALFTGDILSTGYWAAKLGEIGKGDVVAILGAGPTGLCTLQCCRLYHPGKLVVLDVDEERLQLAETMGADVTINPQKEDARAVLERLTEGRGADVVMEVAGGKNTFQMAYELARPNAIVCVVALYEEAQVLPLPDMYGKNLTFKTGGVDASDCEAILRHIEQGDIDVTPLITHTFPLSAAMEAYKIFENREDHVVKIALRP